MPSDSKVEAKPLNELLVAVAAGDRSAFAPLYQATSAKLFGVVLRILRNRQQAEEVLQEVYIRIWRRAADYRAEKGTPMTWMITIARNRSLDWRRRKQAEVPLDEQPGREDWGGAGPRDWTAAHQDVLDLNRCLEELEEQQKDCILLAYCEGYTHQELAVRLDRPVGTVKSWIRRGQIRLKQCLDQ